MFRFFKSKKDYFKLSLEKEKVIELINTQSHLFLRNQQSEKTQFIDSHVANSGYFSIYEINFSQQKEFLFVEIYLFVPRIEYLSFFFGSFLLLWLMTSEYSFSQLIYLIIISMMVYISILLSFRWMYSAEMKLIKKVFFKIFKGYLID